MQNRKFPGTLANSINIFSGQNNLELERVVHCFFIMIQLIVIEKL
jgi:hypothetical protein